MCNTPLPNIKIINKKDEHILEFNAEYIQNQKKDSGNSSILKNNETPKLSQEKDKERLTSQNVNKYKQKTISC